MSNNRLRDMPRSRVFTTGFKFFSGLAIYALVASMVSGFNACQPDWIGWEYPPVQCNPDAGQGLLDAILGPFTFGWKGGIGNNFVFTLFVTLSAVAVFLAGLMTAYRDADPKSVAEAARTQAPPVVNPPQTTSLWPLIAAFSVALAAVGLVVNSALFVAGVGALGVTIVMWVVRDWAETATGDPEVNEEVRKQIAFGLELPLIAVIIIGTLALSLSRLLLTVGRLEAVAVAGVVAGLIFALGVLIAYVPRMNKNAVTAIVIAGVLLVIGAGVVSAAVGEREFDEHGALPGDVGLIEDPGDPGDTVDAGDESGESN